MMIINQGRATKAAFGFCSNFQRSSKPISWNGIIQLTIPVKPNCCLFSFSWREVFDDFSWGSDSDSDEYLDDYEDFEDIDDESLDGMYPRYATSY
jgi:hypothetical protein